MITITTIATCLQLILLAENSLDTDRGGRYQITPICLRDVQNNYPELRKYTRADMADSNKGREVAKKYLRLVARRYPQNENNVEWLCRAYAVGAAGANRFEGYWYLARSEKNKQKGKVG